MSRKGFAAAVTAALACLLLASPAFGFNVQTRSTLLGDAMEFSPQELRAYLMAHEQAVRDGLHFSDISELPVNPADIPGLYAALVERLEAGKLDDFDTANLFGVLACHIAETVYPGHQQSSQDTSPDVVSYDGYQPIENPKTKTMALVRAYSPYHGTRDYETIQNLYGIAANIIADFWTTAWEEAGLSMENILPFGEEVSHGTRATGMDAEGEKKVGVGVQ